MPVMLTTGTKNRGAQQFKGRMFVLDPMYTGSVSLSIFDKYLLPYCQTFLGSLQ